MIRRPPRSTQSRSSAASDVYKRQHEYELPVILDVKRGDIASTGAAYGRAAFGGAPGFAAPVAGLGADALTASPYLGGDSLEPLVAHCADGKGVFVLTRTSNPGAALLQEREVEGRPLYVRVAELVARLGADHILSLIHISEPTRLGMISYAVFCLK